MYLTYEEYQNMGGALDETAFTNLEYDAESTINWYTFNRLKKDSWSSVLETDELKRCVYQLINLKQLEDELIASSSGGMGVSGIAWTKEAGVTKESNDGVSVSYSTLSTGELLSYLNGTKTKRDLVDKYLYGIVNDLGQEILYRGIYPGE